MDQNNTTQVDPEVYSADGPKQHNTGRPQRAQNDCSNMHSAFFSPEIELPKMFLCTECSLRATWNGQAAQRAALVLNGSTPALCSGTIYSGTIGGLSKDKIVVAEIVGFVIF